MKIALAMLYLAATTALAYLVPVPHESLPVVSARGSIQSRLVNELNAHRRQFGLGALSVDPIAQRAAQFQAEDMQAADVMRHEDSSGRSPMKRYAALGGRAMTYGENVAYYGDSITERAQQWAVIAKLDQMMMTEKPPQDGHRKNILSTDYSAVGIGVAVGPHGIFIAEDFVGSAEFAAK